METCAWCGYVSSCRRDRTNVHFFCFERYDSHKNIPCHRIARQDIKCLNRVTAGLNVCDAIWVCIAFPLGFAIGDLTMDNLLNWLLLFYTMIFSLLLIAFHVRLRGSFAGVLRKYFGFMFTWTGRFGFLIFLSIMCFTANEQWWYLIVVGILTVLVAIFNCCVLCNHPAFGKGGEFEALGMEGEAGSSTPKKRKTADASMASDLESAKKPSIDSSPFDNGDEEENKKPASADVWDNMDDTASSPGSSGTRVVALYDFKADENDPEQISMKADDVLTLVEKQDDGWAKVIQNGKKGVVPVQYLSESS